MWLSVLGPLSVRTADGEVVIAAAEQRALADVPSEVLRHDAVPSLERPRLRAVEWRVDADLHLSRLTDQGI